MITKHFFLVQNDFIFIIIIILKPNNFFDRVVNPPKFFTILTPLFIVLKPGTSQPGNKGGCLES